MKYMKLGTRPDTFYTAEAVRSLKAEVSSDVIIQVCTRRYLLHRAPLLSKCLRLQRLLSEIDESDRLIKLNDLPGGSEAFEVCAKFCYGITITLNSFNIVPIRCAAEYLEMTEVAEKGNLIQKLESFLNSCILRGWKDSITALKSTKSLPSWSEDLGITDGCINSISLKILMNPSRMNWSYSNTKSDRTNSLRNGTVNLGIKPFSKNWWGEDIAELSIDLFWRVMAAIKASGKLPVNLIGEALEIYACRWLPNMKPDENSINDTKLRSTLVKENVSKNRLILESIVSLLPVEKGSVSCHFMLKLLKASNILGASSSSKIELARRIGMQLEEARVSDLLIPLLASEKETIYDIDIVIFMVEQFSIQWKTPSSSPLRLRGEIQRKRSKSEEKFDIQFYDIRRSSSASHSSKLKVAKLIDCYLQEIARDENLRVEKLIELAELIPDFARPVHDDLYSVIDIYLKSHPNLEKRERKRLCRILDCKKLSMEVCINAVQNELLPLRTVVQVLFFEQIRTVREKTQVKDISDNIETLLHENKETNYSNLNQLKRSDSSRIDDEWRKMKDEKTNLSTLKMKLREDDNDLGEDAIHHDWEWKSSKLKSLCYISSATPRRMFHRLWSLNRSVSGRH